MFDPMADLTSAAGSEDPLAPSSHFSDRPKAASSSRGSGGGFGGNAAHYGEELHSITIRAKQRTFYIDLKQSNKGKFIKLSEKSRGGQKTTIIFDAEDLPQFVQAFHEIEQKL